MHVIDEPEWIIESSGAGGFRVACDCGWARSGFDTASLARAAGAEHQARPGGNSHPASPAGAEAAPRPEGRKRWWQRG